MHVKEKGWALRGARQRLAAPRAHVVGLLCGEDSLGTSMYGLISYVGACDAQTKTASRAMQEARLIPELVFVVDKFEAAVVTLSAKRKDDGLVALMKKATARDFRIQANEVQNRLKAVEKERRQAEKKEREKGEKGKGKRKREQGNDENRATAAEEVGDDD